MESFYFPKESDKEFLDYIEKNKDLFELSPEERQRFKEWCEDHEVTPIHVEVYPDVISIKSD